MKINKKIYTVLVLLICGFPLCAKAAGGTISVARAFYELAGRNNTQKIESLIQKGYSLESIDERGYNAICLSVIRQNHQAYKVLTSYGASEHPQCLKKIPDSAYRRFFGISPKQTAVKSYVPDSPYLIGTAALATGAIAAAYIFRGDTDGSGGSDGSGGGEGGGSTDPDDPDDPDTPGIDCPPNSHEYDGICICDSGYGNYGDSSQCYATVGNCSVQTKDKCEKCKEGYFLENNICYRQIDHCIKQTGSKCEQCESGYGIHGSDGSKCYPDIPNCKTQYMDICQACDTGYGTYGDESQCYQTIEHCVNQVQNICKQCMPGYDTFGDPYKCYDENPCRDYPNSVPVDKGASCVCDARRGYTGDPYNGGCSQTADDGEYQEGDEDIEEWNNYNELYCNSHGKYDVNSKLCLCYTGYTGDDCSSCSTNYIEFSGLCFRDLRCEEKGNHLVQQNDMCVCDIENGYIEYYENEKMTCIKQISCPLHYEQQGDHCECKDGFDKSNGGCEPCLPGYTYYTDTDTCGLTEYICEEEWTGPECDICPSQYKITVDSEGRHCGKECADNRAPIDVNPECESCADGYEFSQIDNTCITTECTTGVEGYIKDPETGVCRCDTDNNWRMSAAGVCVKVEESLVGAYNSNINNSTITVDNDGILRDVYGMKPIQSEDEEGNITYFDSVYNALSSAGTEKGTIDITNKNTGGNFVYGIYSQSNIYNGAVINRGDCEGGCNNVAQGNITITDDKTSSTIYGLYNSSEYDIYNSFSYGTGSNTDGSHNNAEGNIDITKSEESSGIIVGMQGGKNLYNSYAYTNDGVNANVHTVGNINVTHEGSGNVIGIKGTNSKGKIYNSYAYLDSVVSDAVAEGNITVSGNGNVYGIYSNGTISNSETQFEKNYNIIQNFSSEGNITAIANNEMGAAYGIYSEGAADTKTSIYNAKGYNSTGNIKVINMAGGSAVGIYSARQTYSGQNEEGESELLYNNTYNAFRSSAIYGNGIAEGNIDVYIEGYSSLSQQIIGIYAEGNVYNSYANSGSDIGLTTIGNITINDSSSSGSVNIRGIQSNGATIANAYGTGSNKNTQTEVNGNITINVNDTKNGLSTVAGIYSASINPQGSKIYNAALINDKSSVKGTINISSTMGKAPNRMYGIYATSYSMDESPDDAQPKTVYNAYYENSSDITEGFVNGIINVTTKNASAMSDAEYYGIYIQDGSAYNAYSSNSNASVVGTINVDVYGGVNTGTAVGMYGSNATLNNSGTGSSIHVKSAGKATAYGMKGDLAYITNNAEITVETTKGADAYGIYLNKGAAINDSDGVINVKGDGSNYGIYAISDGTESGKAIVINNGVINVSGNGNNTGIYAAGATATVSNNGTITINGEECSGGSCNNGSSIKLENGATFDNSGTTSSIGSMNFNDWGGNVVLSQGGKFEAEESISGDLKVSSNVVTNTFDKTSMIEDALSAEDVSGVNLSSNSYLYNTDMVQNEEGKYDVVMEMKDFSEVTDADKSSYLKLNYEYEQNSDLYNALKTAKTKEEYAQREADILGTSMIPNIAQENLKVQRSLDTTMMSELFKEGDDVRKMVGADGMYIGRDDRGTLTGYDITSQSMYALYDKKVNNNYRLGLGMSFTHTNTDYNNDSSRKSFMVQGYVPLTYNKNGFTAVSMARIGFADGDYNRRSYQHTFEADTTEITYGWLNELRYKMNLGAVNITPFVGLNAIGWYQDSIDEGDESLALQIASSHIFSLESALGLYLDKDIEFAPEHKLNVRLGAGYYHEFADPYRGLDARINDTVGSYKLRDIEHSDSRDRGIISARVNYDYKDVSIYGELLQYLEKEYPIKVDVGLKYKF